MLAASFQNTAADAPSMKRALFFNAPGQREARAPHRRDFADQFRKLYTLLHRNLKVLRDGSTFGQRQGRLSWEHSLRRAGAAEARFADGKREAGPESPLPHCWS